MKQLWQFVNSMNCMVISGWGEGRVVEEGSRHRTLYMP